MLKLERSIVSMLARRFRSRAVVELENLALRHQLQVLRRQRPDRLRLFTFDRLLWVLLYRLWPRCLEVRGLVKPATVIQWHRQGFRLFWCWRSRSGRPSMDREIRDLIRQMSSANPLGGACVWDSTFQDPGTDGWGHYPKSGRALVYQFQIG